MKKITKSIKNYWYLWFVLPSGAGLVAYSLTLVFSGSQSDGDTTLPIFWIVTGICSVIILWKLIDALIELRHGNFGIDVLAVIAIISCLAVGEYMAAYIICLMLCTGEAIERRAAHRAKRELSALIRRRPLLAHRVENRQIVDMPLTQVVVGDVLLIKPHEVVPVDGQLLSAVATIDESSITGESLPIEKRMNDSIVSGTLNQGQAINIRATATATKSYYSQLIQLVKDAEKQPSHFVNMANRYAIPFTVVSLIIAGIAWLLSNDPVRFAEVLVVASPCPLILAAPIAFVSGMSRCSSRGIIIKGGDALEKVARADAFAFDKTGTLTTNRVTVDHIHTSSGYSQEMIVALIAAAESVSTHPLASSIVDYAHAHNIQLAPTTNMREVPGGGIFASIGRRRLVIGSPNFLANNKIVNLPSNIHNQTTILIAVNGKYVGAVFFTDSLRQNARVLTKKLRRAGVTKILMLTGDRQTTAEKIARPLDLDAIYSELTPTDKVDVIQHLQADGHRVAMVGDGINDAPVLVTADVGIAMGTMGSTAAGESADIVITGDNIGRVAELRDIAKHTLAIAKQSVLIGIVICLILELVALTGFIPAFFGALLQELVDITTITNASRVRR